MCLPTAEFWWWTQRCAALDLKEMARAHPGWRFDGVDPSQPMLDLAAQRLQSAELSGDRVALHHGYVQSAPAGPFDGATCLLTFHFVPREERAAMVAEIRRRLKPGAPFVAVHLSVADGDAVGDGDDGAGERDLWLSRYAAFQVASGMAPEMADRGRAKVAAELAVLTPQEDEAILREAGFGDVRMFYMGFAFRGWVALGSASQARRCPRGSQTGLGQCLLARSFVLSAASPQQAGH
ncbi:class I SAM-dependent methyltransferase [Acidovorax sp. NPDC077693]|uniref:class I SAM-dependent methyltransferase n=1 Tax=unclassified Acidovorax TaxID=2684926 RepID=UPI0037C6899A